MPVVAVNEGLPRPVHVLAVYPVTQTRLNTQSYIENASAKPLNRATVKWFVDKLIRSNADLQDPRLSLVDARQEGPPPVTVLTARLDPLRSDCVKLEQSLQNAGVPVECQDYEGAANEFSAPPPCYRRPGRPGRTLASACGRPSVRCAERELARRRRGASVLLGGLS